MRMPSQYEIERLAERINREMEREIASLYNPSASDIQRISQKYARKLQQETERMMR